MFARFLKTNFQVCGMPLKPVQMFIICKDNLKIDIKQELLHIYVFI